MIIMIIIIIIVLLITITVIIVPGGSNIPLRSALLRAASSQEFGGRPDSGAFDLPKGILCVSYIYIYIYIFLEAEVG